MISKSKLDEVIAYLNANGFDNTVLHYGFSSETLKRYIRHARKNIPRHAKILLFDIETTPLQVYTFKTFNAFVQGERIIQDWYIISWAAKWLFEPNTFGCVLTKDEAINGNDQRIVQSLWNTINEADIIIAHNGDKFDIKRINTRFVIHKLSPPSPYQSIDTLKVARKYFAFSRNNLDYIGRLTSNKQKIKTDFDLWKNCMNGSETDLEKMFEYNKNDVMLLEEVYLTLRPWIRSHPNIAIYSEAREACCPTCGSMNVTYIGEYTTPAGQYTAMRCLDCGAPSRLGNNLLNTEVRRNLLRSTAR